LLEALGTEILAGFAIETFLIACFEHSSDAALRCDSPLLAITRMEPTKYEKLHLFLAVVEIMFGGRLGDERTTAFVQSRVRKTSPTSMRSESRVETLTSPNSLARMTRMTSRTSEPELV
jgi:hypothetical protein